MDAIAFLDSDQLPTTRSGDFWDFLNALFDDYCRKINTVQKIGFIEGVIRREYQRAKPLCDAILATINHKRRGDDTEAYRVLSAALKALGPHLDLLMPKRDMSEYINPLYRFRISGPNPYQRGGLFHIPFELRNLVSPMRYSVASLPSLYLGGSTHVCWRELGEPKLETISVSRFYAIPNSNLRILNFGIRLPLLAAYVNAKPQDFSAPNTPGSSLIAGHVGCWPLIAACAIRVPDRNKPEREEYIIPQMVLRWITESHQFDGIRYFSTHYPEFPDDPKTFMNYVFPVQTSAASGYCTKLSGLFELTSPITWSAAKVLPRASVYRPRYKKDMVLITTLEEEFGRVEDGLLGLPTNSVI